MSTPGLGSQSEPADHTAASAPAPGGQNAIGRIGVDWWATIVAGAIALLAVTNLLPKIPW